MSGRRRPTARSARAAGQARMRVSGAIIALGALVVAVVLAGCETTVETTNTRPMPPPPVAAPTPPPTARANSMVFLVLGPALRDTNGNGRPDLIAVESYLFDDPFPTPFHQDGTFVFELWESGTVGAPGASPIRTWRFEPAVAATARARSLPGPCYRFPLSLLENGGEELSILSADLTARFEAADGVGPPIRAAGVRSLRLAGDGELNRTLERW